MASDLDGEWYNELGSIMELKATGPILSGRYQSAVGQAKGWYSLAGTTDTNLDGSQSLAFAVSWENREGGRSGASTAWAGQLHMDEEGNLVIATAWILREETKPNEDWKATLIGRDYFRRTKPTQEMIDKARKRRARAHP